MSDWFPPFLSWNKASLRWWRQLLATLEFQWRPALVCPRQLAARNDQWLRQLRGIRFSHQAGGCRTQALQCVCGLPELIRILCNRPSGKSYHLCVAEHTFKPSVQETEAGDSLSSEAARSMSRNGVFETNKKSKVMGDLKLTRRSQGTFRIFTPCNGDIGF